MRRSRPSSRARPTPFGPNSKAATSTGVDGRRTTMALAAHTAGASLGSNETIRLAVKDKSASGLITAVAASVRSLAGSGSKLARHVRVPSVAPPATSAARSSRWLIVRREQRAIVVCNAPSRIREAGVFAVGGRTTPSNRTSPRFARVGACALAACEAIEPSHIRKNSVLFCADLRVVLDRRLRCRRA